VDTDLQLLYVKQRQRIYNKTSQNGPDLVKPGLA